METTISNISSLVNTPLSVKIVSRLEQFFGTLAMAALYIKPDRQRCADDCRCFSSSLLGAF